MPAINTFVIPNAIDLNQFKPHTPFEQQLKFKLPPKPKITIATVGSNLTRKRYSLLSTIFSNLGDHFRLLWIGNTKLPRSCPPNIKFVGPLPHSQMPALINSVDAFILLSEAEGDNNSVKEAIACLKPIIISREACTDPVLSANETVKVIDCSLSISSIVASIREFLQQQHSSTSLISSRNSLIDIHERADLYSDIINNYIFR